MKTFKQVIFSILVISVFFIAGFFSGYFYDSEKTEIIKKPIYTNIIKKDIKKMTEDEKEIDLNCYYTSPFILDIEKIEGKNNFQISGCAQHLIERAQAQAQESHIQTYNDYDNITAIVIDLTKFKTKKEIDGPSDEGAGVEG